MPKKKIQQKSAPFTVIGEKESWASNDGKVSEATPLQRKDGTKGISIRMGKRTNWSKNPIYGKSVWIDDDLDLPQWLSWFVKTVKKMYFDLFGRKLITADEEEIYYQTKIEKLNKELAITQQKLEEAEKRSEDYQRTIDLAKKIKEQTTDLDKEYSQFNSLVQESISNGTGKEDAIKEKSLENPWLLGLECSVEAKNKEVDTQTEIDLHVKTKYNQDRIFEFKSPNLRPFQRKGGEKSRFTMSNQLADGLSELITYLRKTDLYSQIKQEGTYGIQKATGYLVIGYNLSDPEKEILRDLNFHLAPHIQVMTYNDLQINIERELAIVKKLEEKPIT